jgi:hypothetical protein
MLPHHFFSEEAGLGHFVEELASNFKTYKFGANNQPYNSSNQEPIINPPSLNLAGLIADQGENGSLVPSSATLAVPKPRFGERKMTYDTLTTTALQNDSSPAMPLRGQPTVS